VPQLIEIHTHSIAQVLLSGVYEREGVSYSFHFSSGLVALCYRVCLTLQREANDAAATLLGLDLIALGPLPTAGV